MDSCLHSRDFRNANESVKKKSNQRDEIAQVELVDNMQFIHVDAACDTRNARMEIGVVIRNNVGHLEAVMTNSYDSLLSPLCAERPKQFEMLFV